MHMRTVFRALCVAVTVGLLVDSGFAWVGPPVAPPSARGPGIGWGHDRHRRCDPSDPNACPDFAFCRLHDGICDSADVMGVCTPVPQACPDVWLPVCGCDGVTYGNRCEAYAARVSIAHAGECDPPAVCDGFAGIPCDDGEFCLHPRARAIGRMYRACAWTSRMRARRSGCRCAVATA